ncbi:MAG: hypothetical protein LLG04_16405 [Parachlamydia sp.]|nr:hypothetical protein [Parachlamydia sp.]
MKTKIAKQFEYDGLGFPILLLNVPLVNIRGVEVPDIDYNVLQKIVLLALCQKMTPFSGNEVRFIRQYLEMNYSEFAKTFGVTHASVIHWEAAKNKSAKISPPLEICIRLHILDSLKADNRIFRKTFREFDQNKFKMLEQSKELNWIRIDSNALASA